MLCVFLTRDGNTWLNRNVSGLPFYDILLLENLPKSASLPVATSQETKRRIRAGIWDFDYIFYTESDQVRYDRTLQERPEQYFSRANRVYWKHLSIASRLLTNLRTCTDALLHVHILR